MRRGRTDGAGVGAPGHRRLEAPTERPAPADRRRLATEPRSRAPRSRTSCAPGARRSRGWRSGPCASRIARLQRADLERRTQALEDRERNLAARARGAEAGQARSAPRARAALGPERRAGQADAARRGRAGGAAAGRRAAPPDRGGDQGARRERRARSILAVAMQRLAAKHVERDDDAAGRAAHGRDEGPDHRPRGPQHPRAREAHRGRRDHRRDALGGRALELRRRTPRDRAAHARAADRRRPDPPGADRGDLRARREGDRASGSPRRASRRRSRPRSTASTPS